MDADWSVLCGAEDPVVVVPWGGDICDPATGEPIRYIDLRTAPKALHGISEAATYPAIETALRRWNRPRTRLFTAKCDVWNYPAKLFDAEDLPGFAWAHASYIDLVPTQPEVFTRFSSCERQLRVWTEMAKAIPLSAGRCEWILRPARILVGAGKTLPQDGFATSFYLWGYGNSASDAMAIWSAALQALIDPVAASLEN